MIQSIKKILFINLLILLNAVSSAQGTWEKINVPTIQHLRSVCFTDSLYGWVCGDSGIILHTRDGGATWARQNSQVIDEISDIFFLNRNLGWASSLNYVTEPYGTTLLKTTNGGADWIGYPYPKEDIFISCILFRDSLNGWVGGRPHMIAKTTNGGIDWTQAAVDTSILAFFPVLSIHFYNDQYGYASGGMFDIAGVTWRTTNGGEMWYAIDPTEAPADEVHELHLFDSVNVIGAGGDPDFGYGVGMIRTSDGGFHWNYEELEVQGNAYDIDFRTDTEVWAPLGPRQKFIYSMDGAVTWTPVDTPDSTAIFDVTFPDSLHGFAVGREGAVLKYKPKIMPYVPPGSAYEDGFILYQNYPNPVTMHTTIKYFIPSFGKFHHLTTAKSNSYFRMLIFNLLGDEVAALKNYNLTPGEHQLEFIPGNLPGGIYFYQLQLMSPGLEIPLTPPRKLVLQK